MRKPTEEDRLYRQGKRLEIHLILFTIVTILAIIVLVANLLNG